MREFTIEEILNGYLLSMSEDIEAEEKTWFFNSIDELCNHLKKLAENDFEI